MKRTNCHAEVSPRGDASRSKHPERAQRAEGQSSGAKGVAFLLAAALLSACGGGAGSPPIATKNPSTPGTTMSLKFTFNTKPGTALRHGNARRPNYVSYATQGLGIDVVSHAGDATLPKATESALQSPAFATQIAPSFVGTDTSCTAAVSGAYSCTVLIAAPVGYDDLQITTWDQAPSSNGFGGTFAANANDLSTNFISNQLVLANQTNPEDFALDGVVASVALQVTPTQLIAGAQTPITGTLSVFAKDADGNYIIGSDPYVDANGNALTITVGKTEAYPSKVIGPTAPANGDVTFDVTDANCTATQCTYTSPAGNTDQVDYNGFDISSVTFNATTNSSIDSSIGKAPAAIQFTQSTNGGINVPAQPAVAYYPSIPAPTQDSYVAEGPDGNLYVTQGVNHTIAQVSPTGALLNTFNVGATSDPRVIAMGSDNALWYVDNSTAPPTINRMTTAGVVTNTYNLPSGADIRGMVLGQDGNLWLTDFGNGKIDTVNVATGLVTVYSPVSAGAGPVGITAGSDGRLWFTEYNLGKVGAITTAGAVSEYSPVVINAASGIYGITAGPDGNLWAVEKVTGYVDEISTAGTVLAQYPTNTVSGPSFIAVGPDGNLWFTSLNSNALGMITPSGVFTPVTTGVTSGSFAITSGPGGNLWFTTNGLTPNELGSVTP